MKLSKSFTTDHLKKFISTNDLTGLSNLFVERFRERYILPFQYTGKDYVTNHKNGFPIVACLCLLIEALILYEKGLSKMPYKKAHEYFEDFFTKNGDYLRELRGIDFYHNIRCGILHQGETLNGWKIRRDQKVLVNGKNIDANIFLKRMDNVLSQMKDRLSNEPIASSLWLNIIKKLDMI